MIVEKIMHMGDHKNSDGANEKSLVISAQEKGSRNKRKFLSEFPLDVPIDTTPALSLTEFPRYDLLEENEKQGVESLQHADWDDTIACQLMELLFHNLSATFRSAIKRIVECGYSEEIAERVVLRSGLYHGSKDVVSTIVDGALALLSREKELDTSTASLIFEDLNSLVEYTMLEMICVLREVKPDFTVAEAMWCLLICDLNLLHACAVEGDLLGDLCSLENPRESSSVSKLAQQKEASEATQSDLDKLQLSKPATHSEVPCDDAVTQLSNSIYSHLHEMEITVNGSSAVLPVAGSKAAGVSRENISLSKAAILEDKGSTGRKASSLNSKKDMLRQKTFHFEKSYKGRMGKGSFKAKLTAWSSMVLDKTLLNSESCSSGLVMKGTYSKVITSVKSNGPLAEGGSHSSSTTPSIAPSSEIASARATQDTVSALPAVNTAIPASPAPEPKSSSKTPGSSPASPKVLDYYAGIPYDESLGKHVPQNEKDETILLRISRMQTLQKELQGWTDWANEKVMQAARRLGKDQGELKILRQDKEDAEKLHKDKQMLEENNMKRLTEMEHALSNASGQIEMANSTLRRLEVENAVLKKEMEAARMDAVGSATNFHQALAREQEILKKCQALEMEKGELQDDFSNLKREATRFEQELERAKKRQNQFKDLSQQQKREKQRFIQQADSLKAERVKLGVQSKMEEDNIIETAEKSMRKCKEDILKLESEISHLRFQSEGSKIEALRRNDNFAPASVKSERECVMCLSEEMTVVFLPCAHLVLCEQCNVLHEKQGMNDCPSCRTPIKKRISVKFARSFRR
ncbi:putative E3 ubiquitin-protein ligase RF298 [Lycium ferocissimum]|uniref:putative E3 ubiquitin-protein ligase RF298 n=1 Tax=Lycium ferocissimum TaxID=112874 RepID=UPI002814AE5A|nr:putative E3 ubiquitin-protein ligase RF298 [Lycium ferocissimum]XP_059298017.1 putative E3 ubiquitin-protein ligase RF298 [Lycium ferocissimum]